MFGHPAWFQRRKYGGWGLTPKTWQGWVYLAVVIAPMFIIQSLPGVAANARLTLLLVWGALITVDLADIMVRMPRDERERLHEALAERNAVWAMVAVLAAGVGYQVAAGIVRGLVQIDPVIIAALVGGVAAKAFTNLYLERRN
ncbi:MAG: hypothetical protein Q7S23_04130 [bacterium]|nr:hypothetical protein [bacterium]